MYESITYEVLLNRMLNKSRSKNGTLDSREGSLLWLAEAPAAVELQNLYIALDEILNETFADTASRPRLILRAKERGLSPYPATATVLELTTTPATLNLPLGTRFSIGELNYEITKAVGPGVYEITCETIGEAGNEYALKTVIPIEYVEGLETCTVTALLIPGEDEEDTEHFRQRYFDSLNAQAFGGNRRDYLEKVNAISGVGGVKVYRAWNSDIHPASLIPPEEAEAWLAGITAPEPVRAWLDAVFTAGRDSKLTVGGTVKVMIIDSTFAAPSEALINQVQTYLDPIQNAGEGVGLAPIGHVVKVGGVKNETINLTFALYYQQGWSWNSVEPYVEEALNNYFLEMAQGWADQEEALILRISQLESRLLQITGILDVAHTTINGEAANYVLPLDHIPVLGTISATTATIV